MRLQSQYIEPAAAKSSRVMNDFRKTAPLQPNRPDKSHGPTIHGKRAMLSIVGVLQRSFHTPKISPR